MSILIQRAWLQGRAQHAATIVCDMRLIWATGLGANEILIEMTASIKELELLLNEVGTSKNIDAVYRSAVLQLIQSYIAEVWSKIHEMDNDDE